MIHKIQAYMVFCDNCGNDVLTYHQYPISEDDIEVKEEMNNAGWYCEGTDPDHKDKHYCPDCFKWNEEEDDKIILDLSRKGLVK